jgi:small subunit ribosomal protein S1
MMFFVKESQRARKKASRIDRKIPLNMRTPLAALTVGADMRGTVISLTTFGAYVDIGTTVDGLLHVSQLSRTKFISHPKEMLSPGDEVVVTVASVNPPLKKLHLTMLSKEAMVLERDLSNADRMALEEIAPDDELWGQVVRVTDFGSYVDVGAVVQGFLHFMDHPLFENGAHPSTFMEVNQRVRVWVSDVDRDQERIKLTANRPDHLPGPRRELF